MEVEEAEQARTSGDGGSGGCSATGPDRLSSLPDCLLHTIMSFLKARQVVQTCVLSKRWRHLWRSVPCLDVDMDEPVPVSNKSGSDCGDENSGSGGDENSGSTGEGSSDSEDDSSEISGSEEDVDGPDSDGDSSDSDLESSDSGSDITTSSEEYTDSDSYIYGDEVNFKEWEDFEDFTVNLMRQCNIAQLDSFHLHISGSRAPKFANRLAAGWLRRAMKYCTPDRPRQHGGVGSGSWHLKSLHLCHVFLDDGFMKRVNSVCCSLEDLELDHCSCEIESVTSQSLKTMVLKHCRWRSLSLIASPTLKTLVIDGGSYTHDCVLAIFAPAVSYLNLAVKIRRFRGGVSINEVSSLAKASIHLNGHRYNIYMSKLQGDQSKLLCSISNVTSLELSGVQSTVLGKEPGFQKFKKLRNLMLNECDLSDDLHILVFFLQSSPILEKLTLRHCKELELLRAGQAMELDDTFTKRARLSGVGGGSSAGGPDLLSNLSDCLLHTIMSFLKARQVVQTCVLSKRWRHLWRSVPCLAIDFDEFNKAAPSEGNRISSRYDSSSSSSESDTSDSDSESWIADYFDKHFTKRKDWEDFEDFAMTLMRHCNIAQLYSFRLRIVRWRAPRFGNRLAAGWLRRAMKYSTPGCANQQGLSSGFWHLKRLHLCHVLLDDDFLKRVSSVCLSLEHLELDDCSCEIQSITPQSLKTLVLKKCRWRNLSEIILPRLKTLVIDGGSNTDACMLVIMAPTLAYLHLAVYVYKFRGGVSLGELPTVAKALIHLRQHNNSYVESKLGGDQFKLLCSISDSINLELSGVGTKVLGKEPRFQEFKNLRNLLLDRCDLSDDLKTLVFFLQGSSVLEKLTLRRCKFPEYSNKKKGTPILRFQEFKNLRSLLLEYCDLSDDFKTLVFFLGHSPTLENLTLRCCEFPKVSSKKKQLPRLNNISSSELRGLDLLCENLKVEIFYDDGHGPHLIRLLQRVSVNLSKNNIKLTKVDY